MIRCTISISFDQMFVYKQEVVSSNIGPGGRLHDPISFLVQLQQGRKEKEPSFIVISERGIPRQPEFIVQVTVGAITATGVGAKKKDAKRAAATKALEAMGIDMDAKTDADLTNLTPVATDADSNVIPSGTV